MYERILLPLDGSKTGEAALPYIERLLPILSPEVAVEVTLLHVISPRPPFYVFGIEGVGMDSTIVYTQQQSEQIRKEATAYLNKIGDNLRDKGVEVQVRVCTGDASEEIIKTAEEIGADLIAMSTHGRSGLSRWAFGSITDKVLRTGTKVPILTIKSKE